MSRNVGTTLREINVAPRRLQDYRGIAPESLLDEVSALAAGIDGARVLHISATAHDDGVAEQLAPEVGLLRDLGIEAEWRLACPDEQFSGVAKRIRKAMQGQVVALDQHDFRTYVEHNRHCAAMLGNEWDVIVVHDPQPVALIASESAPGAAWIWRCHVDASTPDRGVWGLLRAFLVGYDAFVLTLPEFCPPGLDRDRLTVIAPAIDPLSVKNCPLPRHLARQIVASHGIDLSRPLAVQHFDPWKDALGAAAAWRLARMQLPGLQLALIGAIADADPEGWAIYEHLRHATSSEPDCHLFTSLNDTGSLQVNAFQRQADVVVQNSVREGFGLTVSEALWKGTPVIGANAGGIPLQIGDNGGLLVDDVDSCADAIVQLLEDEALADRLVQAGRERVRRQSLTPRLLRDNLSLYGKLLAESKTAAAELATLSAS